MKTYSPRELAYGVHKMAAGQPRNAHGEWSGSGSGQVYMRGKDLIAGGDVNAIKSTEVWRVYAKGTKNKPVDQKLVTAAALRQQGFDGKPQVVSSKELDAFVHDGELELFRGMDGSAGSSKSQREAFRGGDLYIGSGILGAGTYTAAGRATGTKLAKKYAKGPDGTNPILRMTLRKDARIGDAPALIAELEVLSRKHGTDIYGELKLVNKDVSRYATIRGYDAVRVPGTDSPVLLVLNRTALRVQEDDYGAQR